MTGLGKSIHNQTHLLTVCKFVANLHWTVKLLGNRQTRLTEKSSAAARNPMAISPNSHGTNMKTWKERRRRKEKRKRQGGGDTHSTNRYIWLDKISFDKSFIRDPSFYWSCSSSNVQCQSRNFHKSVDEISNQLCQLVHWAAASRVQSELLHVLAVILKVCVPITEEDPLLF